MTTSFNVMRGRHGGHNSRSDTDSIFDTICAPVSSNKTHGRDGRSTPECTGTGGLRNATSTTSQWRAPHGSTFHAVKFLWPRSTICAPCTHTVLRLLRALMHLVDAATRHFRSNFHIDQKCHRTLQTVPFRNDVDSAVQCPVAKW